MKKILLLVMLVLMVTACQSNESMTKMSLEANPQAFESSSPSSNSPIQVPDQRAALSGDAQAAAQAAASDPATQPDIQAPAEQDLAAQQPVGEPALEPAAQPAPAEVSNEPLPPVEARIGFTAPDFTLVTLDGQTVKLSDFRGKNVMVNYWVTWCGPCVQELPMLNTMHNELQTQNFAILTVNGIAQDNLSEVQNLVAQSGLTLPVVLDEGDAFYNAYAVRFLPTSFLIDERGIIQDIILGSSTEEIFRSKIQTLLALN